MPASYLSTRAAVGAALAALLSAAAGIAAETAPASPPVPAADATPAGATPASATPAGAIPAPAADVAVRVEFRAALETVWVPQPVPPDSAALEAYVLFPYLEQARLRRDLSKVPKTQWLPALESRIRAFLQRHRDEPVARDLLRDYLGYLGERRAWADFRAIAPPDPPDLSLRCHALSARLASPRPEDRDGVREAALKLWLAEKSTPPACKPVFAWLDSRERLADAEIEQRARFAARERVPLPASVKHLAPERRELMLFWERLLAQPERELQRFAAGATPAGLPKPPDPAVGEALLEAFDRVARRDSRQALALFGSLVKRAELNDDQAGLLRRSHALGLAYDRDAAALQVFEQVPAAALDTLAHEWRVRAALWNRDWDRVAHGIAAMPPAQQQEPRWRYWRARAVERRHRTEARALYREVAREREYYAFLAAERAGATPDLRPLPLVPDPALQNALAALPAMQRALELLRCELPAHAANELRHALKDRPAAEKAQAALLVNGWGWHEPAVRLLSEIQHWDDLAQRFPLPFEPEVEAAAKDTGVPGDWLYTVLRTESLYDPRAVSRVGALGLLQLMPPTARQVARKHGLPLPQRDDLFRPEVNLALGARYLRELLERFDNRFILTLAAYNAGPQRVPDWLPEQAIDADIWIENIPYNETRTYVQRALSTYVILSWRRRGEPARLAPLLQPVPPRAQAGAS